MSISRARAKRNEIFKAWYGTGEDARIQEVSERELQFGKDWHVPVRIYKALKGDSTAPEACPVLVFAHGGGWVFGSLDSHDGLCRYLCEAGECILVSVGYRQPPEHLFPAALLDVYAVSCWVAETAAELGGDPLRVGVGGDSAGGNLAAAVCLLSRMHQWPPLSFQFLYCPVLAFPDPPPPSHTEAATNNTFLSHEIMKTLYMEYVQDPALLQHPLVSPLRADSLEGLPPAIILTAELDVLRDESRDYSSRLSLAGVAVEHVLSPGALHAAQLAMGANPGAETRLHFDMVGQAIRKASRPSLGTGGTPPSDLWDHLRNVERGLLSGPSAPATSRSHL